MMNIKKVFRSSEKGYSLAEALVVVGIVGVISVVTVPNFITMYRSSKMKAAVRQLASDLRGARQVAVSKHRRVLVSFGTSSSEKFNYWIHEEVDGAWDSGKKHELEPGVDTKTIYFTTNNFTDSQTPDAASRKDVVFLPTGEINPWVGAGVEPVIVVETDRDIPKALYTFRFSTAGTVRAE